MNAKQGDVVIIPVPFSDQTARKARPAIIVSNNQINAGEDVILVPLTSVLKDAHYSVLITTDDLSEGMLNAPSRARADKIFTAHKDLVAMKIGAIKKETLAAIKTEIIKAI